MSKIYISPSNQDHNVGYGNYGTEQKRMFEIGNNLKTTLERCGNTVYIARKGDTFQKAVTESNRLKCDIHLAIHSNAFKGTSRGTLAMYASSNGKRLASAIYAELSLFTPTVDRGCYENRNLFELTGTKAICAYMELAFHDNKDDAALIINNIEKIAELIAKGVCKYQGIKFVEKPVVVVPVVKPVAEVTYRVVTGSFADKENADARVAELKKVGVESFIVIK